MNNRIKNWFTSGLATVAVLGLSVAAQAQVPLAFQYQGVLLNDDGTAFEGTGDMAVAIGAADDTPETADYVFTIEDVTIVDGLFSVTIGDETTPLGAEPFLEADQTLHVIFTPDGEDAVAEVFTPVPLSSVPYAHVAATAITAITATTAETATTALTADVATTALTAETATTALSASTITEGTDLATNLSNLNAFRDANRPFYSGVTSLGFVNGQTDDEISIAGDFNAGFEGISLEITSGTLPAGIVFVDGHTNEDNDDYDDEAGEFQANLDDVPVLDGDDELVSASYDITITATNSAGSVDVPFTIYVGDFEFEDGDGDPSVLEDQTVDAGDDVTFSVDIQTDIPVVSYTWATPNGTVETDGPSLTVPAVVLTNIDEDTDEGDYTLTVDLGGETEMTATASLTIDSVLINEDDFDGPLVDGDPVLGDITAGDTSEFDTDARTADAFAGETAYQWFIVGEGDDDDSALSGETDDTLEFAPTTSSNEGVYYVQVSAVLDGKVVDFVEINEGGTISVENDFDVEDAPSIDLDQPVIATDLVVLSTFVTQEGELETTVDYQWAFEGEALTDGVSGTTTFDGVTEPDLIVTNITQDFSGEFTVALESEFANEEEDVEVEVLPNFFIGTSVLVADGDDINVDSLGGAGAGTLEIDTIYTQIEVGDLNGTVETDDSVEPGFGDPAIINPEETVNIDFEVTLRGEGSEAIYDGDALVNPTTIPTVTWYRVLGIKDQLADANADSDDEDFDSTPDEVITSGGIRTLQTLFGSEEGDADRYVVTYRLLIDPMTLSAQGNYYIVVDTPESDPVTSNVVVVDAENPGGEI